MNLRLSSLRALFMHRATGRSAAAAALAFALTAAGAGNATAAPADAASAPDSAAVSYAAGSQLTIKPGQSLNDVAIAVTQSHDRATLARASRALFDANPNAFMSHDPSRLRLGAVLTVPALDATGAPVAASAASTAASEPAASAAAAAPVSAPNAATAVGVASGVAQVNAAAASAASAAAALAATPAATGTASSAAQATEASGSAASSAPVGGSQAAAPASGTHVWSGSIQPPAGASSADTAAVPAAASQARVSSLQQLLALKNRVLMELQKHGIGGQAAPGAAVATNGAQPAAGVSSATAVSGHAGGSTSTATAAGMSETSLGVAAAVGAALVVLLVALRSRRRKRVEDVAADAQDESLSREQPVVGETPDVTDVAAAEHQASIEREAAARETAQRVAAEREEEIRRAEALEATRKAEAERLSAEQAAAEKAAAERAAAEQAAAERAAAEHTHEHPAEREPAHPAPLTDSTVAHSDATLPTMDHDTAHVVPESASIADAEAAAEPLPTHHEHFEGATTAASLAAAAELGAEALPLTSLEPVDETFPHEAPAQQLQWDDEPATEKPDASVAPAASHVEPAAQQYAPPPVIDFGQQPFGSRAAAAFEQPYSDASAHPLPDTSAAAAQVVQDELAAHVEPAAEVQQPAAEVDSHEAAPASAIEPERVEHKPIAPVAPSEFPRDALDAFSSLDMPLPPRIESDDELIGTQSFATHPVASPESTAQQAVAPYDPDDAPHIADEIAAGTAGHAAVAGLGAAGFGALKLDFDLELPPSPAQPLPAFTQADLGRIARNKLDLAAEYIDLGDLAGARSLINEVIEANDPATRNEARALLSTLAPLS
ncbi:pilus assembly protein FimV [Paraburkholderia sp. GAS199]|uniref:FimV/HubP family polar landmark protein n=1 Tax=Paraburkholderia sp. GAS199 TaxID=3035126 RepID=UPI003D231C6E